MAWDPAQYLKFAGPRLRPALDLLQRIDVKAPDVVYDLGAGAGNVTIHGRFFERQSPGIVGVKRLVVSSKGAVVGAIEQAADATVFAFQPGCRLRVRIAQPRLGQAAE